MASTVLTASFYWNGRTVARSSYPGAMASRLALAALIMLAACQVLMKHPGDAVDDFFSDGTLDPGTCDALAQTGCATGQKCAWIWDERDATAELGHIGCATDGTVAPGGACTFNMDPIGFDNCVATCVLPGRSVRADLQHRRYADVPRDRKRARRRTACSGPPGNRSQQVCAI